MVTTDDRKLAAIVVWRRLIVTLNWHANCYARNAVKAAAWLLRPETAVPYGGLKTLAFAVQP